MHGRAIAYALLSAALFGASTPLAKLLVGAVAPLALAGVLYLASGVGLGLWLLARRLRGIENAMLPARDWPWLAGAVAAGGIVGPALLMYGLRRTDAASASLLLNLEAVFTAVLAWVAFRENLDKRIFVGMTAIVAGGVLLSWEQAPRAAGMAGPLLIAGACLAWALDNNLTRRVSGGDAVTIAAIKGLVAGAVNLGLALAMGAYLPAPGALVLASIVGLFGYGISLVLFIVALRELGTARTGAYFSVAPFYGAALALLLLGERAGPAFWGAAGLMALGVWLHVTEWHEHEHIHPPLAHEHEHVHDEHHQHTHDPALHDGQPHSHAHQHGPLRHRHPHYPDLHHRHRH
ncbi:MAG TPA: DMT family transporter [Burkholderiales bacterium]|nr:DMT family transporter [Burkholderiales bacterium]